MKSPIIALGMIAAASMASAADKPVLNVYTYDSFVSDWGPGPAVEAAFEEICACDLKFTGTGDGAALLARLRLEGTHTEADIVLGLDTNLTAAALESDLFAPHGISDMATDVPGGWDDETFVPFDWGYFAFVHDKSVSNPPKSFAELADSDLKIVIQDPRSSTPGLGLLLWVKHIHGDDAASIWSGLEDNIVTVTKGWSEAYGLFLEGEADMVLSYTTSPSYHIIAEGDDSKAAAIFDDGHYMQIEVAAKLASSDQQALADQFLAFMVGEAFQSIVPTTNWMFPAVTPSSGLPDGFAAPLETGQSLIFSAEDARSLREGALDEWLTALSQ